MCSKAEWLLWIERESSKRINFWILLPNTVQALIYVQSNVGAIKHVEADNMLVLDLLTLEDWQVMLKSETETQDLKDFMRKVLLD